MFCWGYLLTLWDEDFRARRGQVLPGVARCCQALPGLQKFQPNWHAVCFHCARYYLLPSGLVYCLHYLKMFRLIFDLKKNHSVLVISSYFLEKCIQEVALQQERLLFQVASSVQGCQVCQGLNTHNILGKKCFCLLRLLCHVHQKKIYKKSFYIFGMEESQTGNTALAHQTASFLNKEMVVDGISDATSQPMSLAWV